MPILVTCHECRTSFRVKDEFGGRKGKCPKCHVVLLVPLPAASAAAAAPVERLIEAQFISEIHRGFSGELRRSTTSTRYRLAVIFVAIAVLVVPVLFVGLVLAGLAVALFLFTVPTRSIHLMVIKFSFAAAMVVTVWYVLRTLLFRFGRGYDPPDFALEDHPALAALVNDLAQRLGTPVPRRVEFTCDCNAYARYGRGVLGAIFRRELTLGVGLPLLGCTTVTETAGILAHELQHFAQARTARLQGIIDAVNFRLAVAAFHPEQEALQKDIEVGDGLGRYFDLALLICIGIGRGILILLYNVSAMLSAALCRQQEYQSDRSAAEVAGVKAFVQTMKKLAEHSVGTKRALKAAGECLHRRCLPDDLPDLILASTRELSDDHREALHNRLSRETTDLFALHPAVKDRIAAVRAAGPTGIFRCERPARLLVRNYAGLCQAATRGTLFSWFGNAINTLQVAPLAELFPHWQQLSSPAPVVVVEPGPGLTR